MEKEKYCIISNVYETYDTIEDAIKSLKKHTS